MRLVAVLVCLCLTACASPSEEVSPEVAQEPQPASMLTDPAADTDGVVRVLVYHDMEGLSGQDDPRTFDFGTGEYYEHGRQMLVADVNAVVAGLFDGGADEVHIVDGHGSGNPEPDLDLAQLDPRATMIFREQAFDAYSELPEPGIYDAVAVVGMHAKTGSGGFASHTYTLGMDILLGGRSVTETEVIAYSWGRVDVPVILASGDDRLAEDLATMPWLEYVTVKIATGADSAQLLPVDDVHSQMREAAQRAVENRNQARVMKLTMPTLAGLRAVPPARLDHLEGVPGIQYADNTVTFEADDFMAAYHGIEALVGVAQRGYWRLYNEVLRQHPDGDEIQGLIREAVDQRWFDVESDRWSPPEPEAETPEEKRYFGYT
ncbi:MAG: M55 family metallopeptidase [Thermoanaerobaculia bacterium]